MRAVSVQRHGDPSVLELTEIAIGSPNSGELLVRVAAAGVNFIDTYQRSGAYQVALPAVLGMEGAGTVEAIGEGVVDFQVGDRVAWGFTTASYAEFVVVPAAKTVKVPDEVDLETAAAVMLQGMTAHYLVTSTFDLQPGQTCLVHASAGGVGLLLVQLAKAKGATVIATASTQAKRRLAHEAGADVVIGYESFSQMVRELTDGNGVDVVYDGVGKDTFEESLTSLKRRGMMVLFGAASGAVPPFDLQRLNALGSLFVTRPTLAHYVADSAEMQWRASDLFKAIASGILRVTIHNRYALGDAEMAHRDLESRNTTGKLLLIP